MAQRSLNCLYESSKWEKDRSVKATGVSVQSHIPSYGARLVNPQCSTNTVGPEFPFATPIRLAMHLLRVSPEPSLFLFGSEHPKVVVEAKMELSERALCFQSRK